MKAVALLNAMYAVARKKVPLNRQEKLVVRLGAEYLEKALRMVKRQRDIVAELEEKLAIIEESAGKLEDDGTEPWNEEPQDDVEDFWDDFWPIERSKKDVREKAHD